MRQNSLLDKRYVAFCKHCVTAFKKLIYSIVLYIISFTTNFFLPPDALSTKSIRIRLIPIRRLLKRSPSKNTIKGNTMKRKQNNRSRLMHSFLYLTIVTVLAGCGAEIEPVKYDVGTPPPDAIDKDSAMDTEGFTHHFVLGKNNVTFHIVDKGDASNPDKIVFFHGVPDSWYLWQYQMDALSDKYHVIALDLKGAGQSSKPVPDVFGGTEPGAIHNPVANAEEMLSAIDNFLGENSKFHVVSEDWGTVFGEAVVYQAGPERIQSYIRGQAPINTGSTADSSPYIQLQLQDCPSKLSAYIESDRAEKDSYVYGVYNSRTHDISTLDTNSLNRTQEEFSYYGTYVGWVAYQYGGIPSTETAKSWFSTFDFPVLQLEGDSDSAQRPALFVDNAGEFMQAQFFPNQPVYLQWIKDAGHFWPHEAPETVTQIIESFVDAAIRGEAYVPTNSQCARSNNSMYDPGEQFCLNSSTLGTCQGAGKFSYKTVSSCSVADQGTPNSTLNPDLPNTTCTLEGLLCPELIGTHSNCPQ